MFVSLPDTKTKAVVSAAALPAAVPDFLQLVNRVRVVQEVQVTHRLDLAQAMA